MIFRVGVGVDTDRDPHFLCTSGKPIFQIESGGVSVDLQCHTGYGRRFQDRLHIQIGTFAFGDQASGGVTDDIHMRIIDRVQQALGDFLPRLAQGGMQRSDHQIQPRPGIRPDNPANHPL